MGDVLMRGEFLSIVEGDGVHEVADRLSARASAAPKASRLEGAVRPRAAAVRRSRTCLGDGRFTRLFRTLVKADLLILDDWPDRLTANQQRPTERQVREITLRILLLLVGGESVQVSAVQDEPHQP